MLQCHRQFKRNQNCFDVSKPLTKSNQDWLRISLNLHRADVGGVFLGVWYRPPGSDASHIESLDEELERLSEGMSCTLWVGDMSVWQTSWLKHSPSNTLEGERLHSICKGHSLKQIVDQPTRGPNLLDSALSSIPYTHVSVLPKVADHNAVLVRQICRPLGR